MRMWFQFCCLFLFCSQAFSIEANSATNMPMTDFKSNQAVLQKAQRMLDSMPVIFEKNEGQAYKDVIFLARAKGLLVFFEKSEIAFVSAVSAENSRIENSANASKSEVDHIQSSVNKANIVRLRFEGSRPVSPVGQERLPGKSNYFVVNRAVTGISQFGKIAYHAIYPGIDLVFYQRNGDLEYDLIVSPGADPEQIRMKVLGGNNVQMTADQGILIDQIQKQKPRSCQMIDGINKQVESTYILGHGGGVSFFVGEYDHRRPLVIDPKIVMRRRFGGSKGERPYDATVDFKGNLIIVGQTDSADFPTKNPLQRELGVYNDAFILKLSPDGKIIFSTFLGGSSSEFALAVATGPSGSVYVAGLTGSFDFPTKNPIFQLSSGAFIAKLNSTGSRLIYSTYLAEQSGVDRIALRNGCAYIVGGTRNGLTLPQVVNPIQRTPAGGHEIFLMKLNRSGRNLLFSSYFGGEGQDYVTDMSMDQSGAIYLSGWTSSQHFPITSNAFQKKLAGASDGFVSKIDVEKRKVVYSTYIGGKAFDSSWGIAVDREKNAIITGFTRSKNFPTSNALIGKTYWDTNVFVSKLNPSGSDLVYSTYLGGGAAGAISVDPDGNAYITGGSYACSQPSLNPLPGSPSCGRTFLSKLTPNGSLIYSTYHDLGWGEVLAAGPSGSVYLIGQTYDADDIVVARIASQ